ncbi:MAG: coproporphyrinogen III oxidase family protein, partial [Anaerolineae bacterium]|nr:coproporphyrinogen III oxidase family protein [Anaerolineae bacterium]
PALEGFEEITRRIEMSETAFLGLRLVREGLSRAAFAARFGESLDAVFGDTFTVLERQGLIAHDGDCLRLTERAYLISNQVFSRLLLD